MDKFELKNQDIDSGDDGEEKVDAECERKRKRLVVRWKVKENK
jgi:hypothetical protein